MMHNKPGKSHKVANKTVGIAGKTARKQCLSRPSLSQQASSNQVGITKNERHRAMMQNKRGRSNNTAHKTAGIASNTTRNDASTGQAPERKQAQTNTTIQQNKIQCNAMQ
jgi:hypothetical protein